jgi:glutamate synthase (NADPH/NADH) large chain
MKLEVFGDANDFVGKGLSGGTIVVRPPATSPIEAHRNVIIGNTVLYGATAGKLFAAGQAGERFAVRNSGARAVVEGCGSNGCEYMTGGAVAILGPVGDNFAAGMTGGAAFVYDAAGNFADVINEDSVVWQRIEVDHWERLLKALVVEHQALTASKFAEGLLRDWDRELPKFWQIVPKDLIAIGALPAPHTKADAKRARA